MILVLGGGFGLYGHLAALAGSKCDVAAPARYRQQLLDRPEISALDPLITWVDEEQAITAATHIVLARRPEDNAQLAMNLASAGYAGALVLEKPAAPTAQGALLLCENLSDADVTFSVPYLFLHCSWADQAREALAKGAAQIRVDWAFRPSSSGLDWKRTAVEGGGNVAYYFIHCIALAEGLLPGAAWDWRFVRDEKGQEAITLLAERRGSRLVIHFDQLHGDTYFRLAIDDAIVVSSETPFGATPRRGFADPRIPILQNFYQQEVFGTVRDASFYQTVHRRWAALERYIAGTDR